MIRAQMLFVTEQDMIFSTHIKLTAAGGWMGNIINYELIRGNEIWRFALVLLIILVAMATGGITQFIVNNYATRLERKKGINPITMLLKALANPIYVGVFAAGIFVGQSI